MDKTDSKAYETPKVIASLDALDMIGGADGLGVIQPVGCGSCLKTL